MGEVITVSNVVESGENYKIEEGEFGYIYKVLQPEISPIERELMNKVKENLSYDASNIDKLKREFPSLSKSQVKKKFLSEMMDKIGFRPGEYKKGETLLEQIIKLIEKTSLSKEMSNNDISEERKNKIAEIIFSDIFGYGSLQPFMTNDSLEEVMVIGVNAPVYVYHRKYGMCETNVIFKEARSIDSIIRNIAEWCGREIDESNPLLDARLPDGSRANATLSTISPGGPTITIRKYKARPLTIVDLVKYGTLNVNVAAFLWFTVEGLGYKPSNILIAGGTGSGKTTTLNCLGIFIPRRERVITIEDIVELQLPIRHLVSLETKPPALGREEITMEMLLKNALRMRPNRIILNEVRGKEAETLFTAMNTGHDGCMGTVHANTARETINRLLNPPMNVLPMMITSLDLIIMQNRYPHEKEGSIRRVTEIAEVGGMEREKILLNNIYERDPKTDSLKPTGTPPILKQEIADIVGWSGREVNDELEKREIFLDYMVIKNVNTQRELYNWIQEYYKDRNKVIEHIYEDTV